MFHFTYKLSNNSFIIALFSSTNESVWEHTKLLIFPFIIWWGSMYLLKPKEINKNKWFTSCILAIVLAIITIPILYYFYTGAFGINSFIIDILIFFLAVCLGQFFGYKYYKKGKIVIKGYLLLIIFLLLLYTYAYLTYYPLNLPIFVSKA